MWSKNILLQLAKTFHHFFTILFRNLKLIHIVKRRIHHALTPLYHQQIIHIDNICKILPKTANQVIMAVMQKDWEYAAKNLDQYVGISYTILKDRDAEGKEIDTSTHIRKEATNV